MAKPGDPLADEIRAGVEQGSRGIEPEEAPDLWDKADRFTVPAVEPGASFPRVKKLLLRLLRVATRSQGTFNAIVLEGGRQLQAASEALERESARHREAIDRLREEAARAGRELERVAHEYDIVHARLSAAEVRKREPAGGQSAPASGSPFPEGFYLRFEEQFRGPEESIRARQKAHAEFFRGAPGPVLDAGCGRGEFLRELASAGIGAYGVDSNRVAVEMARQHGVDARLQDLFDHLRGLDGSLGGIAALQVVEHLDPPAVYELLGFCRSALAPGGRLLLETINPDSAYALRAYRLDPTHRWPVPAATLDLIAREQGFEQREIVWLSPVPEEEALEERTANDRRLNRWLFGPQDYALRAVRPSR